MKIRVRRYGGPLPGMQPEALLDLKKLGAGASEAVEALLKEKPKKIAAKSAPIPDGYSYEFSLEKRDGSTKSVTVSEMDLPNDLLKHLP